jgi:hypothetical protein
MNENDHFDVNHQASLNLCFYPAERVQKEAGPRERDQATSKDCQTSQAGLTNPLIACTTQKVTQSPYLSPAALTQQYYANQIAA